MSDRDELAKQMFLARNEGGPWLGEYDDHWDFANAIEEADAVMLWLAERLARARADALEEARQAVMQSPHAWLDGARGTCITKLDARAAIDALTT